MEQTTSTEIPISGPVYRIELHIDSQIRTGVITEKTKKKLLEHADELSELGVRIEYGDVVPSQYTLHFWNVWNIRTVQTVLEAIQVAEWLQPGTVLKFVRFLRKLAVPDIEILGLGLGKPERVLNYSRMDKKREDSAIKWKGMKNAPRSKPTTSTPKPKRGRPKKKARPGARRKRKGR